jgi:hypothetical protein
MIGLLFDREDGSNIILHVGWLSPNYTPLNWKRNLRSHRCENITISSLVLWYFVSVTKDDDRSKWPRGLRHEVFWSAQILGSWVRIPLETCMSVCVYSVFVLSCVQVAALRRADPPSKEPYRLCKRLRNRKCGQGPKRDCRAVGR